MLKNSSVSIFVICCAWFEFAVQCNLWLHTWLFKTMPARPFYQAANAVIYVDSLTKAVILEVIQRQGFGKTPRPDLYDHLQIADALKTGNTGAVNSAVSSANSNGNQQALLLDYFFAQAILPPVIVVYLAYLILSLSHCYMAWMTRPIQVFTYNAAPGYLLYCISHSSAAGLRE